MRGLHQMNFFRVLVRFFFVKHEPAFPEDKGPSKGPSALGLDLQVGKATRSLMWRPFKCVQASVAAVR